MSLYNNICTTVGFRFLPLLEHLQGRLFVCHPVMEYQNDTNSTSEKICPQASTLVKCIKIVAYSSIMLTSLLGNLAVIAIVSKNKRMRTTTNYLIANMAASDLLISAFAVPRELAQIFAGSKIWLLDGLAGSISCKLVYFLQDISTAVSIQSLVAIAVDRYQGVVFPFRPPVITSKVCKVIIVVIWMVAMGLHGTYFYTARLVKTGQKWSCTFCWAPKFEEHTQERYFLFLSIFLIFLPLIVILTLYALIVIELKKKDPTENGTSRIRRQRQKENRAIVNKILIIVFLFMLCIFPLTILGLVHYFLWDGRDTCATRKLFTAMKFMFYSNASLNPWVYIILNERYRKGLKVLVNCLLPKQRYRNEIEMNGMSFDR